MAHSNKMPKLNQPITAWGFKGMNNLPEAAAKLLDREYQITPQIILNAERNDGGQIIRRKGFKLEIPLPRAHSIWSGSVLLAVADGILYRIEGTTPIALGPVPGPRATVCYDELDNLIYMANPSWEAVYELLSGQLRPWGLSLPPRPHLFPGGRRPSSRDVFSLLYPV